MKKNKNHILYYWNGVPIYMNKFIDHVYLHYIKFIRASKNYKNSKYIYMENLSDVLDNILLFDYCPICGEKIDWKYLKDMVDEQCKS